MQMAFLEVRVQEELLHFISHDAKRVIRLLVEFLASEFKDLISHITIGSALGLKFFEN